MTTVTDEELFVNADKVKGKVVLITGAANGLGRSAALCFGRHGAKVVIGDLDHEGAEEVVVEIRSAGSEAIAQKCDVTSWEQQVSLFQLAMSTYGRIDIVVPNAGVSELGSLSAPRTRAVTGLRLPTKPNLKTLEVDLIAVLYSAHLALFYLFENDTDGPEALKAIIFIGSMSSIESIPLAPLYSTSKHGLVGLMGSLYGEYRDRIRFGIICPWFVDTAIVSTGLKLFMAGLPLTPVARIGGTIFRAVTDPDPDTNGAIWTLPDGGTTFRLDRAHLRLNQGVYKLLNDRAQLILGTVSRTRYYLAIFKDIIRIAGPKIMPLAIGIVLVAFALQKAIRGYITDRDY